MALTKAVGQIGNSPYFENLPLTLALSPVRAAAGEVRIFVPVRAAPIRASLWHDSNEDLSRL
jgi:hypothetical protein